MRSLAATMTRETVTCETVADRSGPARPAQFEPRGPAGCESGGAADAAILRSEILGRPLRPLEPSATHP